MAKTKQDSHGDADLYEEESNKGNSGEHSETAGDKDVGDYYRELSARRAPNHDRNPNLQIKQAPHELSPADGGEGYVGSNTGPDVGLTIIQGKKGYSQDMPIWEEKSSFTDVPDHAGSTDKDEVVPHQEDSRDEFAPWKHVETDEGQPQTHRVAIKSGEGTPIENFSARDEGGGNPNTQSVPSSESGNRDMASDMPQTEFTHNDGGGAPRFSHRG